MSSTPLTHEEVIEQMQRRVEQWDASGDGKALFLRCYLFMTRNVIDAVGQRDFKDPEWVGRLMQRFAAYYFVALDVYETNPAGAPAVWQLAHAAAGDPNLNAMQRLLAGVNAHINHDLVFALVDLLQDEWPSDDEAARALRHADHCHINAVIGSTIDAAQDQIIEPAMPLMKLVDDLMGGADELIVSGLITQWRDDVWNKALRLLAASDLESIEALRKQVEASAIETGELICTRI